MFTREMRRQAFDHDMLSPDSGAYPKDVAVFPDGRHIASVNHDSGTISFFKVDYEKGLLVMSGRSIPVNEPNCCAIVKIGD